MNKTLGLFLVAGLLLITTSNVFAAAPVEGCTLRHDITIGETTLGPTDNTEAVTELTPNWGMYCLLDAVYTVTDWIFYSLLALVSVLTIWGGAMIVTAGDDSEKVKKGRDFVVYATVGLIVAFLSKIIPSIAEGIVGA